MTAWNCWACRRPAPTAGPTGRHFYTRVLALRDGRILASIRFQRDATGVMWTDIFESDDGAPTCHFVSRVNDWDARGEIVEKGGCRIVCV